MAGSKQRVATDGGSGLAAENPFSALSGEGLRTAEPAKLEPSKPSKTSAKKRGRLIMRRLKAGKGGKVVTEVSGFEGSANLDELLRDLKRTLGTGGTLKGRVIELQGECRQQAKVAFEKLRYTVVGGE